MMLTDIFAYGFMRNALEAGTVVAILAGVVGYFVSLRRLAFAAHALSHVGFAGATGAVVVHLPAIAGLLAFTCGGAACMGTLGDRLRGRDAAVGIVLAWTLGLGVLFLSLYTGYATEAYALLFGEILGIGVENVAVTVIAAVLALAAVAVLYRPLLFASVDEDAARGHGVPVRGLSVAFMLVLAVAVAVAAQVVGILLIFTLLVTPAAIAERITTRPPAAIALSVALAFAWTWAGLLLAVLEPYPVSFFITTLGFVSYVAVRAFPLRDERPRPAARERREREAAASSRVAGTDREGRDLERAASAEL
jgi:zinc/manganese transport system permease protein